MIYTGSMTTYDSTALQRIATWLGTGSINIFGLPFAGKDTHGTELSRLFNGVLLSGGDILRNSEVPAHLKLTMNSGELIPTDAYVEIVLPYLSKSEFKDHPLILSSVGRWKGEENGVLAAAEESGHPIKAVVYLEVDQEEARRRWQASQHKGDRAHRQDDAEHLLDIRFDEFKAKTLPVIEAYRQRGLLIEVSGTPPVDEVSRTIIDKLSVRAMQNPS